MSRHDDSKYLLIPYYLVLYGLSGASVPHLNPVHRPAVIVNGLHAFHKTPGIDKSQSTKRYDAEVTNETSKPKRIDVALAAVVENMSTKRQLKTDQPNQQSAANDPSRPFKILIARRTPEQVLAGYWELPGGKVEPDETPEQAVVRELHEEVGIDVRILDTLPAVEHDYDHAAVRLIPFICEHTAGTPEPRQVAELRWAAPQDLSSYRFPDASLPVIASLMHWVEQRPATPTHPSPAP